MGKFRSHGALDAAFAHLAERADRLALCQGMPASAHEAMTPPGAGGRMLGFAAVVPGLGQGDFALAPGVASGRRLVFGGAAVAIEADGRADHVALVATAGELLLVTPLAAPAAVMAGAVVAVAGFCDEISDPV